MTRSDDHLKTQTVAERRAERQHDQTAGSIRERFRLSGRLAGIV